MNETRLSEYVRQHYERHRLSSQACARLARAAGTELRSPAEGTPERRGRRGGPKGSWIIGRRLSSGGFVVAATILAVLVGMFMLGHIAGKDFGTMLTGDKLTEIVAKEIALNHNKRLNVEFPARSYTQLREKMDKLDFPAIASARLKGGRYQLLGGRYCSIQGQLAAQIKLKDARGRVHTLYQTPMSDTLAGLAEGERQVDGLRLILWREAGLLFGLASPQD